MDKKLFKSVLLIEDNEIDNKINKIIMQSADFAEQIKVVTSAENAIIFLEGIKEIHKIPDLIFLDIRMPGMDGFGFIERFDLFNDAVKTKCRIIMLTSSDDLNEYNRAVKSPHVHGYLKKPLNTLSLRALTS